jgi:hypothetical protein
MYTGVYPTYLVQAKVILDNAGFFAVRMYNVHGATLVSLFGLVTSQIIK